MPHAIADDDLEVRTCFKNPQGLRTSLHDRRVWYLCTKRKIGCEITHNDAPNICGRSFAIFFFSSPHFRNLLTNRLTLFTKMLYPYPCYVSQDGESVASMTAQDPPGYKQPGVSEEVRNVFQRDTVVCAAVYSFSFMVWSRTCKLLRCLEPPCKEQHCSCDAGAPNEQPLLSLHWLVVIVIFEQLYPK